MNAERCLMDINLEFSTQLFTNSPLAACCNLQSIFEHLTRTYQIVAIGRNYAAHAKELGNKPPKEPFFFLKPTSSYLESGNKVEIPKGIIAHHEGAPHVVDCGFYNRL